MIDPVVDQRAENRREPNVPVSYEKLRALGVYCHKLDPETMLQVKEGETQNAVDAFMKMMGYVNRDEVCCCPEKLPNYDDRIKMFFQEHIHEDEEIRLIKEGTGYFDVRGANDEWIRIRCTAGDVIVLPAGIYHRFTMDDKNYTHAIRMFKELPKWTPVNRPCDENDYRKDYVKQYITEPPKKTTVLGFVNDTDSYNLDYPEEFDATMKRLIKKHLEKENSNDLLCVYFSGTANPVTGKSWCPDCVEAGPIVASSIQKARAKLQERHAGATVALLQCTVNRSSYRGNPNYPYRVHPFIMLQSIPTVLVLKAKHVLSAAEAEARVKAGEPVDDEPGVEIISREENPTEKWVDLI